MRPKPLLYFVLTLIGLPGCAHSTKPLLSDVIGTSTRSAEVAIPATPLGSYNGYGLKSLPSAVLARFAPRPIPPEITGHIQSLLDVRAPSAGILSPDGKILHFGWAVTGVPQVWKIEGQNHFPVQLTGGEDPTMVLDVSPDGKFLIISRDQKGEENPGLYLQASTGGTLIKIQHEPGIQTHFQRISSDGKSIYFTANDKVRDAYAIYRWDVAAQKKRLILDAPGLWGIADARDDGRLLLQKETGALSSEIYERDPSDGALKPLFGQGEAEEYSVAYGPNPGEVLAVTNKFGNYRRLYTWRNGKFDPITPEIKFDISGFSIDRPRARVLYNVNENGYTRLRAISAHTHKEEKIPRLPDADQVTVGATTFDGRYTTLSLDDGRHPKQPLVIDWKRRKAISWFTPSMPEVDTNTFSRAVLDTYPARDQTPIPVLIRRSPACEKSICPVVISFHGGPEAQSVPGFDIRAQMFVDAGFVYVQPNVRGSDGYGKDWLRSDNGEKRLDVITDIEDAAHWARHKFSIDGRAPKIGIYGGSYGGYSSLIGMTMFAGSYDAGVEIVGISNLVTFLMNTAPYRRILRTTEYGDPDKDRAALEKLSPITYVDRVKGPMLLIQGANDPRVPVGEALQIHDRLEQKGLPNPLIIFPDEGHGAQKRDNQVLMIGHTLAFFQKYLKE